LQCGRSNDHCPWCGTTHHGHKAWQLWRCPSDHEHVEHMAERRGYTAPRRCCVLCEADHRECFLEVRACDLRRLDLAADFDEDFRCATPVGFAGRRLDEICAEAVANGATARAFFRARRAAKAVSYCARSWRCAEAVDLNACLCRMPFSSRQSAYQLLPRRYICCVLSTLDTRLNLLRKQSPLNN
jgi:hypothetical protein